MQKLVREMSRFLSTNARTCFYFDNVDELHEPFFAD